MPKRFCYTSDRPVDLICMGRVAVDLYAEQIGCSLAEASSFKKYLGGCAGNIAVGAARLGLKSMMYSCIGSDEMGIFLKNQLVEEGVAVDLLFETDQHLTGLVLLGINPPNHFPLLFYRNDCADMQLHQFKISEADMLQTKALLITGTGLSTQTMRDTTISVVKLAKKCGTAVIIDLDFRPVLWGLTSLGNGETRCGKDATVSQIYQNILPFCDLIVGTEEEIAITGGFSNLQDSLVKIRELTKVPVVIKSGEEGCIIDFAYEDKPLRTRPFKVDVLNVLGAGDAFMSGLLSGLLRGASWEDATTLANASGALVVTRHGCAPAIPFEKELQYFIQHFHSKPKLWSSPELCQMHEQYQHQPLSFTPIIKNPQGFAMGLNPIVDMKGSTSMGMNFFSVKLYKNETHQFSNTLEFAAILMTGRVIFNYPGERREVERTDYFSQNPLVLHCSAGHDAFVEALSDCELLIIETKNERQFTPQFFDERNMLELDDRGINLLENTSYRKVRTVFDKRNRPDSNLVVGEIITFQGRWSSYPSHHHEQPEIYHYRFSEPQGFAFGERGEDVIRIEHNDTYQITPGDAHAHCTAPGYSLYTLWFIRHLEGIPYTSPTFVPEHEWTRRPTADLRVQLRHDPSFAIQE